MQKQTLYDRLTKAFETSAPVYTAQVQREYELGKGERGISDFVLEAEKRHSAHMERIGHLKATLSMNGSTPDALTFLETHESDFAALVTNFSGPAMEVKEGRPYSGNLLRGTYCELECSLRAFNAVFSQLPSPEEVDHSSSDNGYRLHGDLLFYTNKWEQLGSSYRGYGKHIGSILMFWATHLEEMHTPEEMQERLGFSPSQLSNIKAAMREANRVLKRSKFFHPVIEKDGRQRRYGARSRLS